MKSEAIAWDATVFTKGAETHKRTSTHKEARAWIMGFHGALDCMLIPVYKRSAPAFQGE
ncbi:MAG: hypothetical protein GY820_17265 [Gammaproteobacteria bacterium]|nr:hypothetical protein [Gammaproteobacteria bacterium]